MRLPYAPSTAPPSNPSDPSSPPDPSVSEIYARIAHRRHPRPLIPLDLTLLHSPPVADGWNAFLGAIRSRTVLDKGLLELAVCRVAVLNRAVYEWEAHAPLAVRGGISGETLSVARTAEFGGEYVGVSEKEAAVLRYTDAMTRDVRVSEEVFGSLKEVGFDEREIVELTAGIAGYNCVSRVLVALDVGEWNGREFKGVEEVVRGEEERRRELEEEKQKA